VWLCARASDNPGSPNWSAYAFVSEDQSTGPPVGTFEYRLLQTEPGTTKVIDPVGTFYLSEHQVPSATDPNSPLYFSTYSLIDGESVYASV
jgi:hypothetical protein